VRWKSQASQEKNSKEHRSQVIIAVGPGFALCCITNGQTALSTYALQPALFDHDLLTECARVLHD